MGICPLQIAAFKWATQSLGFPNRGIFRIHSDCVCKKAKVAKPRSGFQLYAWHRASTLIIHTHMRNRGSAFWQAPFFVPPPISYNTHITSNASSSLSNFIARLRKGVVTPAFITSYTMFLTNRRSGMNHRLGLLRRLFRPEIPWWSQLYCSFDSHGVFSCGHRLPKMIERMKRLVTTMKERLELSSRWADVGAPVMVAMEVDAFAKFPPMHCAVP